jgi:hypothetical protein
MLSPTLSSENMIYFGGLDRVCAEAVAAQRLDLTTLFIIDYHIPVADQPDF